MNQNIKRNIIFLIVIIFILFTTYLQIIIYIPFKNVVKTENMIISDSTISILESYSNNKIDIKDESTKVKVHNVFNDLKLSKNIFIPDSQLSLPRYVINFEYTDSANKKATCEIIVLENGNININGEMFKGSKNIYSDITNIYNTIK